MNYLRNSLFFLLFLSISCNISSNKTISLKTEIEKIALSSDNSYYAKIVDNNNNFVKVKNIVGGHLTPNSGSEYKLSERTTTSSSQIGVTLCQQKQKTVESDSKKNDSKVVIGYLLVNDWEFESRFDKIQWQYLTHINISFLLVKSDGTLNTAKLPYERLKRIICKAKEKGVKVLISVARNDVGEFSTAISNENIRNALALDIICFTRQYGFDGFDIDYEEYSTVRGEANWDNNITSLVAFVKKLHEVKDEDMLMTCAVVSNWLNYTPEWPQYFDYINVMSYDHNAFTSTPTQHASYESFVNDLNYWVDKYKTPKSKLVGGLPFYGYSWDEAVTVDEARAIRFHRILASFKGKNNLTAEDIADKDNVNKTYYNGRITIGEKCMYVQENDFAGVMIWQLFQDAYEEDLQLMKVVGEKIRR